MSEAGGVAVLFDNLGPYHRARLAAAAGRMPTVAIEVSGRSAEYAWAPDAEAAPFERVTLFQGGSARQRTTREIVAAVEGALARLAPRTVAVPGWSDRAGLAALRWATRHKVPVVVMSASNRFDRRRPWLREQVKRRLVELCSAGLVGGTQGAAYLEQLGMPRDRIALGYDTVDNRYFAEGAAAARGEGDALRTRLGLPERYLLCCCRFVAKKNLPLLLNAFAAYRAARGAEAWSLVLAGDGAERAGLEAQAKALGLGDAVRFAGFVQYDALPAYYGLASGFVLPSLVEQWGLVVNEAMAAGLPVLVSERCGCARDLVVDGSNGFTFDPADRAALTAAIDRLAHGGTTAAMGEASSAIIADWSTERFAGGLEQAVATACAAPRGGSVLGRLALQLLLQ